MNLSIPAPASKEMKELKERNKAIRRNYKLGQGGVIGKQLGVSRQRIHQIVHKKQDGFWGRLFDLVWRILFSKDY